MRRIANMQSQAFLTAERPDQAMIDPCIFNNDQSVFIEGYSLFFKPFFKGFQSLYGIIKALTCHRLPYMVCYCHDRSIEIGLGNIYTDIEFCTDHYLVILVCL